MNYDGLIKRLRVPDGFQAPRTLRCEDVVATAITRDDLDDDVAGINASMELIRRTRGGSWPSGPVTPEDNYVDLVWHELEFRENESYTYVARDGRGRYLGCIYLYPMGRRTPLDEQLIDCDVDVSWWVTPDAYENGHYATVARSLRQWLADEFPFTNPHYSNRELPEGT